MSKKIARITHDSKLLLNNEIVEYPRELRGVRNLFILNEVQSWGNGHTVEGHTFTLKGTRGGIRFNRLIFSNNEYVLSYRVKKISGSLSFIGGHMQAFENYRLFIDGVEAELNNSGSASWHYPDDNEEHLVEIYLSGYTTSPNDLNIYIQPNRPSYNTDYELEIWDIKIEKGNTRTPWTPAPEDLGLYYSSEVEVFAPLTPSHLMFEDIIEYPIELKGTRNMYTNSLLERGFMIWGGGTKLSTDNGCVRLESNGQGTSYGFQQIGTDRKMKFSENTTYTLSFLIRGNVTNISYCYFMRTESGNKYTENPIININTSTWSKVRITTNTGTWGTENGYVLIGTRDVGVGKWFEIKDIKVELGNRAEMWSPNPFDLGLNYPDWIQSFCPSIINGTLLTSEIIEDYTF